MRSRARRGSRPWLGFAGALALLAAAYWLLREECPPEECVEEYLASEDIERLSAGLYAAGSLEYETHAERVRALARSPLASELSEELVYVGQLTGDVVLLDRLVRARLEPGEYCFRCLTVGEDSGHPDYWACRALEEVLYECTGSSRAECEPYLASPLPHRCLPPPSVTCISTECPDLGLGSEVHLVVSTGLREILARPELFDAHRPDILRLARSGSGRKVASNLYFVGVDHDDVELLDAVVRLQLDPAELDACSEPRRTRAVGISCMAANSVALLCEAGDSQLCSPYRADREVETGTGCSSRAAWEGER